MSATETETVSLNLDGSFAAEANTAAAAAEKLAGGLDKLGQAPKESGGLGVVEAELKQIAALQAKIANFDPARVRALDEQQKKLAKMREEALGVSEAAEQGASGFERWAGGLATVAGAVALVKSGVTAVVDEIRDAYHAIVDIETEFGSLGAKMAIFSSSKKELQGGIGKKLGGDFDQTRRDALKMGVDPDAAWESSKKLLADKFSKEEIPGILRIKTGMDLAGQNGEGLVTELQKLKLEPKIKSADIDRLYKMGVDSNAVYADLAKRLGTDVPTAMAKVKKGTVDTGEAIKSIEKVAGEKFGGFADLLGDTIPSLIARVKGDVEGMFDGVSLAPVKDTLHKVLAEIEGPDGQAMKLAIGDLFSAATGTALGELNKGDQVGSTFRAITTGVREAAAEVRALRPEVHALLAELKEALANGTIHNLVKAGGMAARTKITEMRGEEQAVQFKARAAAHPGDTAASAAVDPIKALAKESGHGGQYDEVRDWVREKVGAKKLGAGEDVGLLGAPDTGAPSTAGSATSASALDAIGDTRAGAMPAGQNLSEGMAEGITAGESSAIDAAEQMAAKALQAAKDKLGVKSPSVEFGEVGNYSAEGMANAMDRHPGPEAAGKRMAGKALGGAQAAAAAGGKGGPGGAGGPGGGGGDTYHIELHGGASDQDLAKLEAMLRRVKRAQREGAAMPTGP